VGPDLNGFQSHVPEEHVRLIFPDEHSELRLPEPDGDMLRWPRPMPVSREYTVRRHDPGADELDVDFVIHVGGIVSDWAFRVMPGSASTSPGHPAGS
jgi:NADPH-dependent ferric siderophore reductase